MTRIQSVAAAFELLAFELAGIRYGLPLQTVREVVRAVLITPLPDAPAVVEGVINVRGVIVPVYDLRARFELPPRALHPDDCMVLAWTGERLIAFRAERVDWLGQIPASAVESADAARSGGRHLTGVAKLADGMVLIQDLAGFLAQAERMQLDAALSAANEREAD